MNLRGSRHVRHVRRQRPGCPSSETRLSSLSLNEIIGEPARMIRLKMCAVIVASLLAMTLAYAQEPAPSEGASQAAPGYVPKFKGDPARSDSEAAALAYMRVVVRAEKLFNKQYGHYALNLN